VLLSAVRAITEKHLSTAMFLLALLSAVFWVLCALFASYPNNLFQIILQEARCLFTFLFLSITGTTILKDISSSKFVSGHTICGAICVYLLVGLSFAMLYISILIIDHHALLFGHQFQLFDLHTAKEQYESLSVALYFSFCTMTTLGYGDITPVGHIARTLAWLEAVFGQLYIAILVGRLVALYTMQRKPDSERI
jgi:hypothetical protein